MEPKIDCIELGRAIAVKILALISVRNAEKKSCDRYF